MSALASNTPLLKRSINSSSIGSGAPKGKDESITTKENDRFEYAYHAAEIAVEKLINSK